MADRPGLCRQLSTDAGSRAPARGTAAGRNRHTFMLGVVLIVLLMSGCCAGRSGASHIR